MARPRKQDGARDSLGRWVVGNTGVAAGAGRPTLYNKAMAAEFAERIKYRTTIEVCQDADMPDRSTILNWMLKYPEFSAQVEKSRESYAEFVLETAQIEVNTATSDNYKVAALLFKSASWRAERVLNHHYGAKNHLEVTGDIQNPITIQMLPIVNHTLSQYQEEPNEISDLTSEQRVLKDVNDVE